MAFSFVRQSVGSSTGAFTVTAGTNGNELLLCMFAQVSSGVSLTSLSQTNVTWTLVASQTVTLGFNDYYIGIWKGAISGGASGTTLTPTFSGTYSRCVINLSEYSGGSVANDGTGSDKSTTGSTSVTSNGLSQCTTTAANDLLISCVGYVDTVTPSSGPGGVWTDLTNESDGAAISIQADYSVSNSSGNQSPTWTLQFSARWLTLVAGFKLGGTAYTQSINATSAPVAASGIKRASLSHGAAGAAASASVTRQSSRARTATSAGNAGITGKASGRSSAGSDAAKAGTVGRGAGRGVAGTTGPWAGSRLVSVSRVFSATTASMAGVIGRSRSIVFTAATSAFSSTASKLSGVLVSASTAASSATRSLSTARSVASAMATLKAARFVAATRSWIAKAAVFAGVSVSVKSGAFSGVASSKVNAYAVLSPAPGVDASKSNAYAVVIPVSFVGVASSKANVYAEMAPAPGVNISKAVAYAILAPPPPPTPQTPPGVIPLRIVSIEEDDHYNLVVTAEPFVYGCSAPVPLPVTPVVPYQPQVGADPGAINTPIIFEPVARLCGAPPAQLWIVASAASPNYGGCVVYLSTNGGASYNSVGQIGGSAITGLTVGDWPPAADPDTTNNLALNLTESLGALASYSASDRDNFVFPCYVAGGAGSIPYEIMAYNLATLTSAYHYTLAATGAGNELRRSVYAAPTVGMGVDHPNNSRFAFLGPQGPGILQLDMDPTWIGVPLKFKFAAFNNLQGALQSTSGLTVYSYTPTGIASSANPNVNNYSESPADALTNPTGTTIAMAQVSVTFPSNVVNYNARTFTIPAPSVPTTYYVTVADPTYIGDTGSTTTLTATCQTSQALCGAVGNTYIGSILALPGGGGTVVTPGGWPAGAVFLVNGT